MKRNILGAHAAAYFSLFLSVALAFLWACNVGGLKTVSLDTFVGVIVGLLAIIVTFAIGWQIYNAMEINQKIEQLDEKMKELHKLKMQFEEQNKKIEQLRHEASHFSAIGIADSALSKKDYLGAYRFYQSALYHTLCLESPINALNMVDDMCDSILKLSGSLKLSKHLYEEVESTDAKIRKLKLYSMVQDKNDKAFALFKKKVSVE